MNTPNTKINTNGATAASAGHQLRADHHQPGTITMSVASATRLLEVLQTCDEFLRTAPHNVRVELAEFCLPRPGINSGCLIDAVGLHALLVNALINDQQTSRQQAGR